MTNREYLNTLSDEEFATVVLRKSEEFKNKNCVLYRVQSEFEQWLKQEHISIGADDEVVLRDFMKKTERK